MLSEFQTKLISVTAINKEYVSMARKLLDKASELWYNVFNL